MLQVLIRAGWTGLITWALPFLVSMFFYDRNGAMATDIFLFKSIMIVTSNLTVLGMLRVFFAPSRDAFLGSGILAGTLWLAINVVLDVVILLPLGQMSLSEWLTRIGIGYLTMPATAIVAGLILKMKVRSNVQNR